MSHTLLDQLRQLEARRDRAGIINLTREVRTMDGPAADRAMALHILGQAHWDRTRDPWDVTAAIRYAREACRLDLLEGEALYRLGAHLITIGRYNEGRLKLQTWLNCSRAFTRTNFDRRVADINYSMGYAARYEGNLAAAADWYRNAMDRYAATGRDEWANLTACALTQVLARSGNAAAARTILDQVPVGQCEAYRLKATVELLAAEGNIDAALATGELASEHLVELEEPDPWELAELHLLLSDLQFRAGDLRAKEMHAQLALDAMRSSERHDLYRAACLLLDYEPGLEVIA